MVRPEAVTLMPRIASSKFAAGAVKLPIRLFDAVTFVPAERTIPFIAGEVVAIAPLCDKPYILFLNIVTAVPPLTEIPLTTGEVAPEPDKVLIALPETLVAVAAVTAIPTTVDDAPVEERVLIVLLLMFIKVEVLEHVIPVTLPPVPVDDTPVIVLEEIVTDVAVFTVEPIVIPVIPLCPLILFIVLLERLDTPFQ